MGYLTTLTGCRVLDPGPQSQGPWWFDTARLGAGGTPDLTLAQNGSWTSHFIRFPHTFHEEIKQRYLVRKNLISKSVVKFKNARACIL